MITSPDEHQKATRKRVGSGHLNKKGEPYISPFCDREHYWEYDVPARPHAKNCRACVREESLLILSFPEIAEEFDTTKNEMQISELTSGSTTTYWWVCTLHGHEFQTTVNERINAVGLSCKECKHLEKIETSNLLLVSPEIAKYYDETKNQQKASQVDSKSQDIAYWTCDADHSYTCAVYTKVKKNSGCNECARSRNQATPTNNLLVKFPELAKELTDANNTVDPFILYPGSSNIYSWLCELGHIWESSVTQRTRNNRSCPQCKTVKRGLLELYPEIASEFDVSKNGKMSKALLAGSSKVYWWRCESLDHEWKATVVSRTSKNDGKGAGCPQCEHLVPSIEYNAGTVYPNFIVSYDTEKNILPLSSYLPKSMVKVWWQCEQGHPKYESFAQRSKSNFCGDCPKIVPVVPGKSLGELNPDVANEFNVDKNGIMPFQIMAGSGQKMFWTCAKGHEWEATVASRAKGGRGCPYCSGWRTESSKSIMVTHPEIAKYLDSEKNDVLTDEVGAWSHKNLWWLCENDHSYQQMVFNKVRQGDGCPYCSGRYASEGNNLAEIHPSIAQELDEEKNGFTASEITAGSSRKVWWKCENHSHSWEATVSDRTSKRSRCPYCTNFTVLPGFNDLATLNPKLAEEFDETKTGFKADGITTGSTKRAYWKCSKGHSWEASVHSRARRGMGCPECSGANSSKIEIAFRKALVSLDGWDVTDESNKKIVLDRPKPKRMMVDINAIVLGKKLIVEYDGYYYHSGAFRDNRDVCFSRDILKTRLLLENGYHVIRIREKNFNGKLDFLDMNHIRLFQIEHDYKGQRLDHNDSIKNTIYQIDKWIKSV